MADKRDILIRLLGEETVSKMSDRAGDGLDRFGDKLDATEKDAKDLDKQIAEVEGNLKALAVAFARTNDAADRVDITRAIRKQQTELRRLTKAKDLLPDLKEEGSKGALSAAAGFAKALPGALRGAVSSGPGAVVGGILAAWFVPTLSAAAAGAIVGGVGIGGVVGGIALAAKDSRVQAAGKDLAATVTRDLEESGSRFVEPTLQGIGIIRAAWNNVADDVDGVFEATARYVEPLARGVGDFVRQVMPGVRKAAEAAGPIIREIGEGLPRIGRAIGDVLSDLSGDADEGASALRYMFQVVETGVRFVGAAIHMFAGMYRAVLDIADAAITAEEALLGWNPLFKGTIAEGRKKVDELKGALDKGGDAGKGAGDKIEGGLLQAGAAADDATGSIKGQAAALDELAVKLRAQTDPMFALIDAQNGLRDAQRDYNKAVKEHGKRSPEAQEALRKMAQAAIAVQTATGEAAGTFDGKLTPAMKATLRSAGFTEAEIADLEKQFKTAKAAGDKFAKNYHANVFVDWHYRTFGKPGTAVGGIGGAGFKGLASGGPVEGPGPKGVDSVPRMLAPGEHVLTAAEVDRAGGHAAVERLRAMLRSGNGLTAAPAVQAAVANWGPAPSPARTVIELRSGGSRLDDLLVEILRRAIADRGGNVQTVLGRV